MHMIDVMKKLQEIAEDGYNNEDIQRGINAAAIHKFDQESAMARGKINESVSDDITLSSQKLAQVAGNKTAELMIKIVTDAKEKFPQLKGKDTLVGGVPQHQHELDSFLDNLRKEVDNAIAEKSIDGFESRSHEYMGNLKELGLDQGVYKLFNRIEAMLEESIAEEFVQAVEAVEEVDYKSDSGDVPINKMTRQEMCDYLSIYPSEAMDYSDDELRGFCMDLAQDKANEALETESQEIADDDPFYESLTSKAIGGVKGMVKGGIKGAMATKNAYGAAAGAAIGAYKGRKEAEDDEEVELDEDLIEGNSLSAYVDPADLEKLSSREREMFQRFEEMLRDGELYHNLDWVADQADKFSSEGRRIVDKMISNVRPGFERAKKMGEDNELAELMQLAGYTDYAEKIEEYANEPEEDYMDAEEQLIGLSGGLNGPKKMYAAAAGGDNPMDQEPREVTESTFESFYKKYDKFVAELTESEQDK